jgi:DNA (cytosine-5)-methyltransferase 1
MSLTKISLFSGIGGDDLASEWAGIDTICFVEIDSFCQKVLKKHWPNIPIIGDIHEVTPAKVKEVSGYGWVDIIAGGDPCQPRSVAGKRRGHEDDRDLWKDMLRVISEFKPTWVINENPTGRLTMDFHEVLSNLESIGYETRSFVIPACAVNALHRRDRLFIVAYSNSFRLQGRIKGLQTVNKQRHVETDNSTQTLQRNKIGNNLSSPEFSRANDGVFYRVDRLKTLGNAIVPQQIYPIYKAIIQIEGKPKQENENVSR